MVDQTSVVEIAYSLSRRVEDVRFALGIHDDESQMGDDMIRELESSILKGGIICDPEVGLPCTSCSLLCVPQTPLPPFLSHQPPPPRLPVPPPSTCPVPYHARNPVSSG